MDGVSVFCVLITVIAVVSCTPLNQQQVDTLSDTMSIKAKNLYNLRDNEKTHTIRLYVKNTGSGLVPPIGWKLYFHSMHLLYPDVFPKNMTVELEMEHISIGMVQGDLYYLEPSLGFVGINPGEEREYDIIAQYWMISRTDFMPLWYIVSNNADIEPRIVKSTQSLDLEYVEPYDDVRQWKRFAADRYNPFTARKRLERYKTSDKRKIEKIVIPTPKHVEVNNDVIMGEINDEWTIFVGEPIYKQAAEYLSDVLQLINVTTSLPSKNVIILNVTDNPSSAESYTIQTDPRNNKIYLKSYDRKGVFNAANSLWSIVDGYKRKNIPGITIIDEPRYHYRGLHIDVARNFHGLSDIKRIMTAMAMYKMNKLHLHLSDDEGWRLEIPGLPELTEIGGQRCHDYFNRKCIIPQFGSGPFNTSSGSGYFTTQDYKELLLFAKERYIEVIPEFDMPGHAHAAIFSMEERYRRYHEAGNENEALRYRLSDPDDKSEYISVQQWLDNAINPCVESVYTFIGKVMDEVIALHKDIQPLNIYHFGGDEVANHAWEKSPKCMRFTGNNPKYNITKGVKIYFVERVAKLAAERNVSLAGWEDGFADGEHEPIKPADLETDTNYAIPWNSIWEWGGGSQAYKLANAGFKVILAPATNIYFDHPQEPDPEERGLYWATRFTDTFKVLKFMPDSMYNNIFEHRSGEKLTKAEVCGLNSGRCEELKRKENIIGMEGTMFSETIRTSENVDYMLFPRLVALAERAWHKAEFEEENISVEEREDRFFREWEDFANTLGYKELHRLENIGIKYRVPPPGARVRDNGQVAVSTVFPGLGSQYSYNKGHTWFNVSSDNTFEWRDDGGSSLHLRTLSANNMRHSRAVELFMENPRDWSDQPLIDYFADNVEVHVEVISNLEKTADNYIPIELKLRNGGDTNIPRGTWKLYFYSMYGAKVESLACGLKLEHENGGLYFLTPEAKSLSGIAAGATLTCRYHNRYWMIARSDNMPNWYVTSLGMTAKVLKSTESEIIDYVGKFDSPAKWKRVKNDQYDPYTPATRYDLYNSFENRRQPYRIVPMPFKTSLINDVAILFTSYDWKVVNSSDFPFEVGYLSDKLEIPIVSAGQNKIVTFVKKSPSEDDPEAYDLDINSSTITITAGTSAGAFYGIQSLISLIDGNDGNLIQMKIIDKPRFKYRGVMPDTSRNFKQKDWILKFIDVMSMYKLNKLHLHLTDDEGWRLEIPSIPELTQIGSKRCHSDYDGVCTIPQLGSGPDTNSHGSGFYTVQDYKDILKYADDRYIQVIPEIETPGHATAAIVAMEYRESIIMNMKKHGNKNLPESYLLSNHSNKNEIFSPQKWTRNAMNPCLDTTYKFVETVVDNLIEFHRDVQPLEVIHLGGDEVPSGTWDDSEACLAMLEPGQRIDTENLRRMFSKRAANIVAAKGLKLASWDDGIYAENKPNPISDYTSDVYVYTWDNRGTKAKRVSEFANEGYKVVLPLATHLYFDHPQEPDPEERGLQWATRFTDTEKVFGLMPDDIYANFDVDRFGNKVDLYEICEHKQCPTVNKTKNFLGLQACMFSETMRTEEQFHDMAFPRLLALAERSWHKASWEDKTDASGRNVARDLDWKAFSDNLGYKELSRLDKYLTHYRIPPPGARINDRVLKVNTKYANLLVEISKDNGKTWNAYEEDKMDSWAKIHLRSRSKTSNVTSRNIEISALNQKQIDTIANTVSIKAKNLYNLRDNEKTHTIRLFMKNNGNEVLPQTGWRLYFHSMFLLYPDVFPKNMSVELEMEHITIGMVQGDLYYLEPSLGFVGIKPGEEREYDIIAKFWMISRTDFMPLWYFDSQSGDIEPRVVKTTENLELDYVEPFDDVRQWKRFAADRYNPFTAQERLKRFKTTDKRKIEKIVIPTPKHFEINEEVTIPELNDKWTIFVADPRYKQVSHYLSDVLQLSNVTASLPSTNVIILDRTDNQMSDESYSLRTDPRNKKIFLKSKDEKGIFNAANSLWSIVDGYKRRDIPEITITDEPRYKYRGLHIDVARNFHGLSDIKRIMTAMAMYKMNKLHLHLSDDEGWRLEIPGLPELTEVGGQRCHDYFNRKCIIPQFGSGPFNTSSGSGYFTTQDYKELLLFAKERHIEVIPEFDMPGHAHAAIFSMEERYRGYHEAGNEYEALRYRLSDPDDKSEYISVQQWLDNAINPCVESVYTFIGKVMDEVIALHKDIQPLNIYHFGGDEVANHAWEKSPKCMQFTEDNPEYNITKGVKIYFVERVAKLAAERNVSLGGWEDGFADGEHKPIEPADLETDTNYAIAWNSIWEWGGGSQANKLANAGFKVILAQATNIYFDHPQEPDPEERGLYWATRYTDTYKVLKFMPDSLYDNIFEERSGKETTKAEICGPNSENCEQLEREENIVGMEGTMFSETIRTSENVDYMLFPRLIALAERAWHKAEFEDESISVEEREDRFSREWEDFANTLGYKELHRLDNIGIKYRVPPPGGRVRDDGQVEVSTEFPGLGAQYSYNKGNSWLNVSSDNTFEWRDDGGSSLHLRTMSANGMRQSRVVELFKDDPQHWSDQALIDYFADNVEVHVEVISNLDKTADNYIPLELKLRNSGETNIPRGTWKLYFYSLYGAKVESLACGLKLGHENGGLYYFTPEAKGFSGIAAGATLTCRYHNKYWMIARSDNMPNWYVTSRGMTAKVLKSTESESIDYFGKLDSPAKWKRVKNDRYDPYTPATRYDLYKSSENRRQRYKIVPTPFETTMMNGAMFSFSPWDWKIVNSSNFQFEVQYLAEKLNASVVSAGQNKIVTFVKKSPSEDDPEAYDLDINSSTITITAGTSAGAFYGVQSIISLIDGNDGNLIQMKIRDKPRFQYRGVMPDSSRNFKQKDWILKFIDVMSMYKLNKLHLHLTDDEGWRLEIPSIPELTQMGSKRCHSDYDGDCTIPQLGSGPDTTSHGSGFYTVQDYKDILKYADDRHIQVIPEIETPGHATAAIVAMEYRESIIMNMKKHGNKNLPESYLLSNHTNKNEIFSPQKWTRNAMDPCLNTTYRFVETVVDNLIALHQKNQPLTVIHLGGDEVPDGVWDDSNACLDNLEPGQKINTEHLRRMFSKRAANIVAAKGIKLASWDDGIYADNKPNPISDYKSEVHVYTWDNRGAKARRVSEFANEGYKVVLPLATHLYFDHPQEPDPEERGLQWATRFTDTEKVFGLMPDDIYANFNVDRFGNKVDIDEICEQKKCPTVNKPHNILGLQACMFSETMRTEEQFHEMAFPRLLALAERAWHKASWEDKTDVNERNFARDQDWKAFSDNLGYKELSRLDKYMTNYRIPPPGARIDDNVLKVNTKYTNLLVEISRDNGKTWTIYEEAKMKSDTKILLRARSKTSDVTSRHIEISTTTVSCASKLCQQFSLIVFILYIMFNRLTK